MCCRHNGNVGSSQRKFNDFNCGDVMCDIVIFQRLRVVYLISWMVKTSFIEGIKVNLIGPLSDKGLVDFMKKWFLGKNF